MPPQLHDGVEETTGAARVPLRRQRLEELLQLAGSQVIVWFTKDILAGGGRNKQVGHQHIRSSVIILQAKTISEPHPWIHMTQVISYHSLVPSRLFTLRQKKYAW